ncbi:MAG: hypothetical protein LJE68_11435 [Rhodobacter sp.]|nr:hypothetical protein [Rhodobacter sp.]
MIRRLGRIAGRILLAVLVALLLLGAPVAYNETLCRGKPVAQDYTAILPPEHRRAESRTFLTYPEWHIVHAYDDYGRVIQDGDPHDYRYLSGISGFWSSLCALSRVSARHGGFDWETKQTIYTIGVSFSVELALKAAYEETIGRMSTWIRGPAHSPLDDVSALQAAEYAEFLQQVPWYRWDFDADVAKLAAASTGSFRDRERRFALGVEFGVKAAYARAIAAAVANIGPDALTLRMIVRGGSAQSLSAHQGVTVISSGPQTEIETPRYRELTHLLERLAADGVDFVEIAGNDDIMLTAISSHDYPGALFSFDRQGYGDRRHLIALKVTELADWLRQAADSGLQLEHIHDY